MRKSHVLATISDSGVTAHRKTGDFMRIAHILATISGEALTGKAFCASEVGDVEVVLGGIPSVECAGAFGEQRLRQLAFGRLAAMAAGLPVSPLRFLDLYSMRCPAGLPIFF